MMDKFSMLVDAEAMRVYVADRKIRRVQNFAKKILLQVYRTLLLVSADFLCHFCDVFVSLTLAVPLARFYTQSLFSIYLMRLTRIEGHVHVER